jgi:uncharacterized membrane protein YoaK (UPF0700 family)
VIRHDREARVLAIALAALAGYVDATAFIMLGGFFVSFMSGNTTRFGVGLATGAAGAAQAAALLLGAFVLGVVAGSLCGHAAGERRRPGVMVFVSLLLAAAAVLAHFGLRWTAAFALAFAMGAENAVFERDGDVQIGLTYMTGTLVRCGQRIAAAMLGGPRMEWLPYLLLWLGLLAGTIAGAAAERYWGQGALWTAAGVAAILAVAAARTRPTPPS